MKKLSVWMSMLLMFSLLLAACGGSDENDNASGDEGNKDYKLVEDGKFTFASSGEFKPFSYADPDDPTKMVGYDIAVANAIAEELGLEPSPQKYKFASIIAGVKGDRFDAAVASHTITDERAKEVDFTEPYYYSGPQIFVRPDSDIETAEDLKGKDVAVSKGSTYAKMAVKYTDNIKTFDSDVVALQALSEGKNDAVITDFITGQLAIKSGFEIVAKERLGESEQAIAISKENPELLKAVNEALQKLKDNGTLAKLSKEWIGEDITTSEK
ncbi:transporter substrate-binding domain-containing protein [Alkalihalobacillus sp. AL-G]|uniref:transporter substrate-binding domain-containing protein n=1 Tax=Alkalihalobacillus sp. AL-G TaxID=2926399 RepID=UPI00272C28EC|nr:transporter substrate-binding domain-containing protein [Alkalihalobacillus sp. AL-G]WLD92270.1 transporter substrate-binding domain-containing protein [Alkalihalobacillus sp. AL-G]